MSMCAMVEVFKTNIDNEDEVDLILFKLGNVFPEFRINFDLEDSDKVMRIESPDSNIEVKSVIGFMNSFGFYCKPLD